MALATIIAWNAICWVWIALLHSQKLACRRGLLLEPRPAASRDAPLPSVCIVVAARNESAGIEACVRRLLAQDHPSLSVVVADDRSEDDTAATVARVATTDDRLSLTRVTDLPVGWLGKSHALWTATRGVRSDWLLFTDADCALDPCAARVALEEARRRNAQLLSLWPRNAAVGFWEHLIIPLCGGIIALWFGSLRGDPSTSAAFANGQFLLIERSTYERAGGHRAVRDRLIEDVPLAEAARAVGARTWTAGGRDLVAVRMYDGLRPTLNGWSRIYVGSLRSTWRVVASIAWLVFGSLLPFAAMPLLLWTSFQGPRDAATLALLGTCAQHLALVVIVSRGFWKLGGCDRRYLWLYPFSVALVVVALCRTGWWLSILRRVSWRGRSYPIDAHGRIVALPIGEQTRPVKAVA